MHLLDKFVDHRSYRNGDINSYMDTLVKAEFTASIRHIGRFLKSGIPIYNFEVPNTVGRKTRRKRRRRRRRKRRTQAIAKLYALHANAITFLRKPFQITTSYLKISLWNPYSKKILTANHLQNCCLPMLTNL